MVDNDTDKQLRELTISLHRTITTFSHSSRTFIATEPDLHQADVTTKQVAENILEAGQPATKGHASARGWWLGTRPRNYSEFEHSIMIPV
jgi:hypothetical protein